LLLVAAKAAQLVMDLTAEQVALVVVAGTIPQPLALVEQQLRATRAA
jgi:hypothetical protein